ncbi:MAG: hypothetical protein HUJ31_03390 [Pseudomonadales bacterium]|nr:hypothetical protein [Pseudomonadales bacterium]
MNRLLLFAGIFVMGLGIGVLGVLAYVTVNTDSTVVIAENPINTMPAVEPMTESVAVPERPDPVVNVASSRSTSSSETPEAMRQANSGW